MSKTTLIAGAAAALMALGVGAAQAQSGFGPWERFTYQDGVFVEYAVKRESDGFRVAWRCRNMTSQTVSCSIGAGNDKRYNCYRGSSRVGQTGALGERATVRGDGVYTFPSESACRGTGASSVQPYANISIED
jgi:hypothetical protein